MPESIAERLRDAVDKHLGIDATGKRGDAPKQTRLPARVINGVTEEHIDEPKDAAPGGEIDQSEAGDDDDERATKDQVGGRLSQKACAWVTGEREQGLLQCTFHIPPTRPFAQAATKDSYRQGMIAVIYLEGDGALVLGTGEQAREVPVKPGRLVVWPNTDFIHSAYGKQRRCGRLASCGMLCPPQPCHVAG